MKHFTKYLAACAMLCMMACSEKDVLPGDGGNINPSDNNTFATLTLSLPTTRSTTTVEGSSEDSIEVAQDYENSVKTVIVVLANKNAEGKYEYITSSIADSERDPDESDHDGQPHPIVLPTYQLRFETQKLKDYAEKTVYLFAYANPTSEMVTFFNNLKTAQSVEGAPLNTDWVDKVYEGTDASEIWAKNSFLMTNKFETVSKTIPAQATLESVHNVATNPFELGTIDVQRVAARFDFKQLGTLKDSEGNIILNNYEIKNRISGNVMGAVVLDGMAMVNIANGFYYLPRVSANGINTGSTICGSETSSNYVVSPYAEEIAALSSGTEGNIDFTAIGQHYNTNSFLPNITDYNDLTYTTFNQLSVEDNDGTAGGADDWNDYDKDGNKNENFDKTGYYIWQYTTENTIPQVDKQIKGITTGVVFKAHLLPIAPYAAGEGPSTNTEENQKMIEYMKTGGDLYLFNTTLYAGPDAIHAAIINDDGTYKNTALRFAFDKIFTATKVTTEGEGSTTTSYTVTKKDGVTSEDIKEAGFKVYPAEKNGENLVTIDYDNNGTTEKIGRYNIFYTYYNRHNDNGNASVMAPMEFGVVRNNVYKLSVNIIYNFGVPGDDIENPNDPDENPETYFKVRLHVMPWVVRINQIEF